MSQELIIEVVSKLLQDKNNESIKNELPTVICSLLKPFNSRAKPSKELEKMISKMIRSYGICSRCHSNRLKRDSDVYCKNCKSVLKERAKESIE